VSGFDSHRPLQNPILRGETKDPLLHEESMQGWGARRVRKLEAESQRWLPHWGLLTSYFQLPGLAGEPCKWKSPEVRKWDDRRCNIVSESQRPSARRAPGRVSGAESARPKTDIAARQRRPLLALRMPLPECFRRSSVWRSNVGSCSRRQRKKTLL
jgi:hypothetical protein